MADVDPALGQQMLDCLRDSGYFTYILTTRRIASDELLK
jgi:hypothetical protein